MKKIRKWEHFEENYYLGNGYYFEKHHCSEKQDNWHPDSKIKPVFKIVLPRKMEFPDFFLASEEKGSYFQNEK